MSYLFLSQDGAEVGGVKKNDYYNLRTKWTWQMKCWCVENSVFHGVNMAWFTERSARDTNPNGTAVSSFAKSVEA